jgi:RNA polymerase sigma-70 factor (ECF subfamily)
VHNDESLNASPSFRVTNDDSYARLIGPIEDRMLATVWRVLRNPHDAEDALQNALACIWKQWPRLERHANPRAFVLKICADAAIDQLRRRHRSAAQPIASDLAESLPTSQPRPDEELIRQETLDGIMEAVSRLSRNQAVAVVMRFIQDESYDDIAAALGCGPATARKHVARGREKLERHLAHLDPWRRATLAVESHTLSARPT